MGAVLYTFVAGLIIVLNQFSFIQQYLQIPQSVNFLRMFLNWLDRTVTALLGDTRTEAVVVGLFWAVVGLCVYVFLRGIARFISELEEGVEESHYLWPRGVSHYQALKHATEDVIGRIVAFIGLLIMIFGPLNHLLNRSVYGLAGVEKYIVWFVLIWLSLHVCVVFMRLVAMRARLFG